MSDQNDNITTIEELNEALPGFARVEVSAGRVVDLTKIAVIALMANEMLSARPDLFGGAPVLWYDYDERDESKQDDSPILDPRAAAEWACTRTLFARTLPGVIEGSGECARAKYAVPFVVSALARCEPFVLAVAARFKARIEPSAILKEKLHGYLERYGERLVFEVLQKASTPAHSCTMPTWELREMIMENHLETQVGKAVPVGGLNLKEIDGVLEDWMYEHDDRIHELLGYAPEFGREDE